MKNTLGYSPEDILKINGFENISICKWKLTNGFGKIVDDTHKQNMVFTPKSPKAHKEFIQEYDDKNFDPALVSVFVRSGMHEYLHSIWLKEQGGT